MVVISREDLFEILSKKEFWNKQLCLETVKNISHEIECKCSMSFLTDDRNLNILRAELFRLNTKALKAKVSGGNQWKKFKSYLTLSKYSWDVQIDRENTQQIVEERIKYEKLLAEKESEKNDLFAEKEKLEKKFATYVRNNVENTKAGNECKSIALKRKPFEECTPAHQTKRRKQESALCKSSLSFLNEQNIVPISVTILRNGKQEVLKLYDTACTEKENTSIEFVKTLEDMNTLIYVMDTFNISKEAYHELSMIFKSLPRTYAVNKVLADLNSKYNIVSTPDGLGVQQSLEQHLKDLLSYKLKLDKNFVQDGNIKIKISGDGTNVGKRIHVVNITFTIINESHCGSAQGNYPLAIIRTKENYSDLAKGLADLRQEVDHLQGATISVCEREFKIEILLGGDYKFLLVVCGIPSIACRYFCIYCKCSKAEKINLCKTWSCSDASKGARLAYTYEEKTHATTVGTRKKKKRDADNFFVSNKPMFSTITPDRVVIDHLHMFLRITDKLFNLLVADLRCMDNISANSTFTSVQESRNRLTHISKLESALQKLGITFELNINTESRKLEYRDLTGPEKIVFMNNFTSSDFFENACRASDIQNLWDGFKDLNECVKSELPNADVIEEKALSWCELYVQCYQNKDITPYIHMLRYHVGELVRKHGNLVRFTQQGLEKFNDMVTKQFCWGSTHKGTVALQQVIQKQNRLHFLEHYQRKKEIRKCLKCKETTHNISTCTCQPTGVKC